MKAGLCNECGNLHNAERELVQKEFDKLNTTNAKFREALEIIAKSYDPLDIRGHVTTLQEIARRALKEGD